MLPAKGGSNDLTGKGRTPAEQPSRDDGQAHCPTISLARPVPAERIAMKLLLRDLSRPAEGVNAS